jgi:uncharacterized OsmC-like protein
MSGARESVRLTQAQNYQFDVDFGPGIARLRADEPPPLGQGAGPSPVQLLGAAVGNCLAASLTFAFGKFRQQVAPLTCTVDAEVGRNAEGRLRVLGMQVTLALGVPAAGLAQLERVLGSFEAYCTVTQSVSAGFPVRVSVVDAAGVVLK